MYYLTKSNGIISDKQFKESKNVFKCGSSICYYVNIDDDEFETLDHIIKQSDNVFDLIEVGDLVKEYGNIYEISDINSDNRRTFVSQPADFKHQEWEISAIYKPNDRGNYIKVWEVKE